jgi:hypothetical protein
MARKGMTKPRPRRPPEPLPEPLPPERRTVGQLVAETIRFYQHHFWRVLPLGISVLALEQLTAPFGKRYDEPRGHPPSNALHDATPVLGGGLLTTLVLSTLLFTASYIVAIVLVTDAKPDNRRLATAYGVGCLVFLPTPLIVAVLGFLALPAIAYLALVGWAVPAALVEGKSFGASLRRGLQLGRADYVHALGGLATLVIVFVVVRLMLVFLIHVGGELGARSTSGLADLVLAPVIFVGSAILYLDQSARAEARE